MLRIPYQLDEWLCRRWIPLGFALFLIGIFWAPEAHIFAVVVPYCLLLPTLLAAFMWPRRLAFILTMPTMWMTAAFLFYMAASAIILNGSNGVEFSKWAFYISLFIIGIGVYMDLSVDMLAKILLVGATAAVCAGFYAAFVDMRSGAFWLPLYRLKGYANLYNELRTGFMFGAFALFAYWYSCSSNVATARWQRGLGLLIAIICLSVTILTGSRAPLLALAGVGIWLTLTARRWGALITVLTLSCAILAIFWNRLSERGISLRPEIWRYVFQQSLKHPWFGIGLDRYPIEVPTSVGLKYGTHNIFLAVFYQGGIIGLALFMAMVAVTFYQSWCLRSISRVAILAALFQLYAIIALQFEGISLCTRPTDTWLLLWLPLALCMYAQRAATSKTLLPALNAKCAAS